ncbi:MAG: hypothetical protein JNL40_16800 [Cyclobacteriaceae bacterium]|nr:hypothetical protein [Cyclobacteriaceae bacterium]
MIPRILLLVVAVELMSCSSTWVKSNYVPKRSNFEFDAYGSYIKVTLTEGKVIAGELIGIRDDSVVVLNEMAFTIPIKGVVQAQLITHNPNDYAWGYASILLTIANGGFAIFTGPLWLFSTAAAVTTETQKRFRTYPAIQPKGSKSQLMSPEEAWNEMMKFSRFPMGIPRQVELSSLTKRPGKSTRH